MQTDSALHLFWRADHKQTLQQTAFDRYQTLFTKQQSCVLQHPLGDLGVT